MPMIRQVQMEALRPPGRDRRRPHRTGRAMPPNRGPMAPGGNVLATAGGRLYALDPAGESTLLAGRRACSQDCGQGALLPRKADR
jgi:hypothetical protein